MAVVPIDAHSHGNDGDVWQVNCTHYWLIGRRMVEATGYSPETLWFQQRMCFTVHRGKRSQNPISSEGSRLIDLVGQRARPQGATVKPQTVV